MDPFLPSSSSVGSSSPPPTEALMEQVNGIPRAPYRLSLDSRVSLASRSQAQPHPQSLAVAGASRFGWRFSISTWRWKRILFQLSILDNILFKILSVFEAITDLSCAAGEYTHLTHLHHCRSKIFSPYKGIGCILAHLIQSRYVGQECLVRCEQYAVQPNVLITHTSNERSLTISTLSRAANATMSAHETTPLHTLSNQVFALSMTSNPRRLGLFGGASFSAHSGDPAEVRHGFLDGRSKY
ncbi:hypothetical protein CKAN_00952000 [Cinnamomum micranthum f. kanehirae]|uniref:Uncharacterized protein n=1 Tax=Cinnamomum micranthum f. kanehirae TaxID=337451 RepID=A0A3S3NJF2_9MAGN|nr:hypothetical protein CKAN_00952000 [Cinnamomum micranthum f. kanehirae]